MSMGKRDDTPLLLQLKVSTDASFAPGGDRSRSGVVVSLNDVVVHWVSQKQQLTSLSSCEAELNAAVIGLRLGIGVQKMVEEITSTQQVVLKNRDTVLGEGVMKGSTIPMRIFFRTMKHALPRLQRQ